MQESQQPKPEAPRPERVISHALVELRRHSWWPFGIKSALLLDISPVGFKLEFTGNETCNVGDTYAMVVPLSPFSISTPASITIKIEVKWFDASKMRIGGVFTGIDTSVQHYVDKIIEAVKSQPLGSR